jgi:hypothetical protein
MGCNPHSAMAAPRGRLPGIKPPATDSFHPAGMPSRAGYRWVRLSDGTRRARYWLILAMMATGGAATTMIMASSAHARSPVYRDPPSYRGPNRVPQTKPAPLPPRVVLSASGTFPDLLVDEAGTAHIVWNDDRGQLDDAAMYCRLKRGGTACDGAPTALTWPKTYGPGDGPEFNIDDGGPRIVRVGDQLVVFSKRYPTGAVKPDGASSSTVIAWTSGDGGRTWAGPGIVGKWDLGQLVVLGASQDPTILNVGVDPLCTAPGPAGLCIEAYKSGQYTAGAGNLSTGADQNYYPGLVLDRDLPVAAASDLAPTIHLRRWTGTGDPMDSATWAGEAAVDGTEPSLAGGPAGAFMLSRSGYSGPLSLRSVSAGAGGVPAPGQATRITGDDATFGRLFEDPGGRLTAAWSARRDPGAGVLLRSGFGASGLGPAQRLIDGAANGQIALGAAADGGGFALLNHTGGVTSPGQIVAVGFGTRAATGQLGLGGLAGGAGGATSCQQVRFGSFTIDAGAGCFLNGTGVNAGVVVTGGEVTLNGLHIVPDAGAKLVIDSKRLRIDTIAGAAQVFVENGDTRVVLWHGAIHRDLSRVTPGTSLFEFPSGAFKANVLGFDVSADIPVRLASGGVRIPVDLKLPDAFGGFAGHAELIVDTARGLQLDSLHIHIGPVPIGALTVEKIDIDYTGQRQMWSGSGRLTVPAGGSLDASVRFEMGALSGADMHYSPSPAITIGPFVYLLRIGGGFELSPVHIFADAMIGAGAAIQGSSPITANGRFDMVFPRSGPASFRIGGDVQALLFGTLGDGFVRFQTDGYATFGGHAGLNAGPLEIDANLDGFIDAPTGQFGGELRGSFQLCLLGGCYGTGVSSALSSKGFAACVHVALPKPPAPLPDPGSVDAGVKFPWTDFTGAELVNPLALTAQLATHITFSCSTSDFHAPPPAAATAASGVVASGAITVSLPSANPTETILVEGAGGAPDVTLTGPGGVTISSAQPARQGRALTVRGIPAMYFALNAPTGGSWTVTPNPGSVPLKRVLVSDGFKPLLLNARLRPGGRQRAIAYRIANGGHGQSVQFAERGAFGTRLIGKPVTGTSGTLRFRPADTRGTTRALIAFVLQDGVMQRQQRIATFTAPSTRPSAPGRISVRRGEHTLTVAWGRAQGAARYVVRLRGANGTHLAEYTSRRSVTFSAIRHDERIRVDVRAVARNGNDGPARTVTSSGPRR